MRKTLRVDSESLFHFTCSGFGKVNGYELTPEYLHYVRNHPIVWNVPTQILYGSNDNLTSFETMNEFVEKHHAGLTVMENGEHWFHTNEQMRFLDNWIKKNE